MSAGKLSLQPDAKPRPPPQKKRWPWPFVTLFLAFTIAGLGSMIRRSVPYDYDATIINPLHIFVHSALINALVILGLFTMSVFGVLLRGGRYRLFDSGLVFFACIFSCATFGFGGRYDLRHKQSILMHDETYHLSLVTANFVEDILVTRHLVIYECDRTGVVCEKMYMSGIPSRRIGVSMPALSAQLIFDETIPALVLEVDGDIIASFEDI